MRLGRRSVSNDMPVHTYTAHTLQRYFNIYHNSTIPINCHWTVCSHSQPMDIKETRSRYQASKQPRVKTYFYRYVVLTTCNNGSVICQMCGRAHNNNWRSTISYHMGVTNQANQYPNNKYKNCHTLLMLVLLNSTSNILNKISLHLQHRHTRTWRDMNKYLTRAQISSGQWFNAILILFKPGNIALVSTKWPVMQCRVNKLV